MIVPKTPVITANKIDPTKALRKFVTSNPCTIDAANANIRAFKTNENNPNVRIFNGKDRIDRMGRTKKLSKPMTKAAIIATPNELIAIPGRTCPMKSKTSAVKTQCKSSEIIVNPFSSPSQFLKRKA